MEDVCSSYVVRKERHSLTDFEKGYYVATYKKMAPEYEMREVAYCFGTKECELCKCGGDRRHCDFYEEVRKAAK